MENKTKQNTRYKMLLIEDDKLDQMAFKRSVAEQKLPYDYKIAPSVSEAHDILASEHFDIIISDYALGDGTAFDILNSVKTTPIVLTTGTGNEEIAVKAWRAGARDYLVKDLERNYLKALPITVENAIDHKKTEEQVRLLSGAITSTDDSVYITDMQDRIIFVNRAFCETYGYEQEEVIGKNCSIFWKANSLTPDTTNSYLTAAGWEGESYHQRKDGNTFPVSLTNSVIQDSNGNDVAIVTVARDITESKQAEMELKKYRDNLEALVKERTEQLATEKELLSVTLSSMSDGVIVVDAEKRIMLFNTVAENLTGWKSEEVQGKLVDEILQIINERTKETVESSIGKALTSGNTEAGTDQDVLIAKHGRECPISATAAPIHKNGTIVGIVMALRDVSREREIDHMKTDFVSSVSHELRTPLASVKAYTATILRDNNMPEQTRYEFLNIIDEESNRLANLIESLLEISRIESGTVKIVQEPVDVAAVINQISLALQPLADKKNIQLKTDISDELVQLLGDESKIQSIVTNIVNNAIKFTPENGKVSVSVRNQNEELVIRVSDTGIGIPKEALPKIFDRFYRVLQTRKQIQGTGLGLAIAKEIVTMHGGRIEVESKVGQGTTFTVFLPLQTEQFVHVPVAD